MLANLLQTVGEVEFMTSTNNEFATLQQEIGK